MKEKIGVVGRQVGAHSKRFVRNKKVQAFFMISFAVVIFDQMSKWIIEKKYEFMPKEIIGDLLSFSFTKNTGGGFGIMKDQIEFFIAFSLFVILFIILYRDKIDKKMQIPVAFILGGIFGNLIDRWAFGYVRDFIDISVWPVFNIADMFIFAGVVCIIYYVWKEGK